MIKIIGRKLESNPNEIIIKMPGGSYAFPTKVSTLTTKNKINQKEYALVQEGDKANSAISMTQRFNGKNHLDTNIEVLKSGLVVPRTSKLVTQIINVNQALKGEGVLYDASGNLIKDEKLKKYANTLNHDCWVWLNESFEKGGGFLDLDVVYITGLDNEKPIFQKESLQKCLERDCYADLESINEQGFPTKESPIEKYELGKSIYFNYPRENRAVGFVAGSGFADFDCRGLPRGTFAWLGVFTCAEGASAKKSGEE